MSDRPPEQDPNLGTPGAYPPPPPYGAPQYGSPPPYGAPQYGSTPAPYGYAAPPSPYAHWGQRLAAYLIDGLLALPFYIVALIGLAISGSAVTTSYDLNGNTTTSVGSGSALGIIIAVIAYAAMVAFVIWNQVVRQGRTGWSIGKRAMRIRLVDERTGQPIGAWLNFVRQLAHLLDALPCYLGYLWPLWDSKRQTFADKIMSTVVIPQAEPPKS
jgi:uncharacterized RDD family membrane protein YckC